MHWKVISDLDVCRKDVIATNGKYVVEGTIYYAGRLDAYICITPDEDQWLVTHFISKEDLLKLPGLKQQI